MTASNLFAYDRGGSIIVIGDGKEILAQSGADESPLWRAERDSVVVALGATADTVFAVDASGALARWGSKDGQPGQTVELGAPPKGLAVARTGACAVVLPDAVAIVARGVLVRTISITGASAAGFSAGGSQLAVGSADGSILTFSIDEGSSDDEPLGKINVGEAVRSLAWNAGGFWLVTGGDRVFRVDGDCSKSEQVTRASGMTPDCVACSEDGSLIGLRLDPSTIVALAYPSRDTAVTIQYVDKDKRAVGLAFGPPPFFGVGLTGGDGNKINLRTEAVHRTDTHPGRTHNKWMLSCAIDAKSLPKAYADPSKAAAAPEPPEPVASRRRAGWPEATSAPEPAKAKGGMGAILIGLGLLVLGVLILAARCQ